MITKVEHKNASLWRGFPAVMGVWSSNGDISLLYHLSQEMTKILNTTRRTKFFFLNKLFQSNLLIQSSETKITNHLSEY